MEVDVGGSEEAAATFARDQWMMLRTAKESAALARIWRRPQQGLLLGRFHRFSSEGGAAAFAGSDVSQEATMNPGISRRLSGGRIVPVGPGVLCVTMTLPRVDWMQPPVSGGAGSKGDATSRALRPEQVLNRALRPLLAVLRDDGVDAFYPGRDLVTVGGRALAHASFTVMRDGVAVVEMQVAEESSFSGLAGLLDRFDPEGVAGVEREALASATSLVETRTASRTDSDWAARFAAFASSTFGCEGAVSDGGRPAPGLSTLAHAGAARDFLATPGPVAEGSMSAAAVSMLGVVECAARLRGDRLAGLTITGDVIAPFHTLDDIAAECEGEPFRAANVRKALARALARPRSFLLGLRDLDELILRMA
ncbi:MAG: hypothetical protein ABR538_03660 [Candidatus Binatia bacterium]